MSEQTLSFKAEADVKEGRIAVAGSGGLVKQPGAGGAGKILGIFTSDVAAGKMVGVQVGGKFSYAHAGGNVTFGEYAAPTADEEGKLRDLPTDAGSYEVVGKFLQAGTAADCVAILVNPGKITVTA